MEEERHMRQVVQKKTNAAVIIQKFYRRNAAKNAIHKQWRQQFDINEASSANNKEVGCAFFWFWFFEFISSRTRGFEQT